MAQVQRRPFERCDNVTRENRRPGVGEERDKGKTRETETSWIMSVMKQGKGVKINGSTSNTELFFHFTVTDTFLSLPKISSGVSFPKHPNPRAINCQKRTQYNRH